MSAQVSRKEGDVPTLEEKGSLYSGIMTHRNSVLMNTKSITAHAEELLE